VSFEVVGSVRWWVGRERSRCVLVRGWGTRVAWGGGVGWSGGRWEGVTVARRVHDVCALAEALVAVSDGTVTA
jgi:hypothetical protein